MGRLRRKQTLFLTCRKKTALYRGKPDPHIIRIKNDLEFLIKKGFEIIQDDSTLPEYDSFRWEPKVIYYNQKQDVLIETEVDYRGSGTNMKIGSKLKPGNSIPYDLNFIITIGNLI